MIFKRDNLCYGKWVRIFRLFWGILAICPNRCCKGPKSTFSKKSEYLRGTTLPFKSGSGNRYLSYFEVFRPSPYVSTGLLHVDIRYKISFLFSYRPDNQKCNKIHEYAPSPGSCQDLMWLPDLCVGWCSRWSKARITNEKLHLAIDF